MVDISTELGQERNFRKNKGHADSQGDGSARPPGHIFSDQL